MAYFTGFRKAGLKKDNALVAYFDNDGQRQSFEGKAPHLLDKIQIRGGAIAYEFFNGRDYDCAIRVLERLDVEDLRT